MDIIRRGVLIIITPLFSLLLFITAFDWGVVKTVGQPAAVKQIVSESGVYNSLIPNLLTTVKQVNTDVGNLSATDPAVTTAANQAFSPDYIKQNAETIIDSTYDWLDGKTAEPNFSLNLSGAKTSFADSLASQFQQKATALPKCTSASSSTSFNISTATCLPPGVTAASVGQAIKDDVAGGKDFLQNPVISADSVKDNSSNKSIFQGQLKSFPTQYQRAKKTPTILIILTLLAAVAIFFLSPNHLKGLRHLGITLLLVGLFMLVFAWGLNRVIDTKVIPRIKIKDNSVITDKVRVLATDIAHRVDRNYWIFGGVYSVLGAVAIGTPMIINRRKTLPVHGSPASPKDLEVVPQEPKPAPKPKKIIRIQ